MDTSDTQLLIPTQRESSDPPPQYDQSQLVKAMKESSDREFVSNVSTDSESKPVSYLPRESKEYSDTECFSTATESKPVSNLPRESKVIVSSPCDDSWNSHYLHNPYETRCPHCQTDVWPQVEYKRGVLPWLVCCFVLMTCIFAVFAPFALCTTGLKDIIHLCPVCSREIRRLTKL